MTKHFLAGLLAILLIPEGYAETVQNLAPGQTGVLFDQLPATVVVKNLSTQPAEVRISSTAGPALMEGQAVSDGFTLLDGTLHFDANIPPGDLLATIRMGYDPLAGRRRGSPLFDESSIRLMRFDSARRTWRPAWRSILRGRRTNGQVIVVDNRRIQGRADRILGHYGVDTLNRDAWSVTNVNSDYALGALLVPEPLSLIFFLAGISILLLRRTR